MDVPPNCVWVFNGSKGKFPGGIFTTVDIAEQWIARNKLTGVLTQYPIDQGAFEWALERNLTTLRPDLLPQKLLDSDFIGSFSSASFEHYHYENGGRN